MFKKTEESEWTRFSRALGGNRDQPREREDTIEIEDELIEEEPRAAATPAAAPPPANPPASPQAAPPPPPAPVHHSPPELELTSTPIAPEPVLTPAQPTSSAPSTRPVANSDDSVIGDGTTFDGSFKSDHSIRIHGAVQGEVESKQRVTIEETARVQAKVTAEQIVVDGEVDGELTCPGRVEITPSGRVTGTINAGLLVMQEGAYFEGQLKMLKSDGATSADRTEVGASA
jgi:cytoskeletal protein CcmA (bactofilin family)